MVNKTVRLRVGKNIFETMVNLDSAMKMRKGDDILIDEVIADNTIYTDLKKGMRASTDSLMNAFNTSDFKEIVERIVKKGEIEVTQEFRDEALENRKKQVVDFLIRNGIDSRTNRPFTADIIESAIKEAGVKIENTAVEKQINNIISSLNKIIPIRVETKKIKVKIPAEHTGKAYGLVQEYKDKENWLGDGSLEITLNIPVGLQEEFYDKLNSITHGSAITEEVKE